jgi:predicted Zn-dependent protease
VDDEGVVCRRIAVLEQGVLKSAPADLTTATRLGVPATGHGRRGLGGPPSTGWSNLEVLPGSNPSANGNLAIDHGILIRELPFPSGQCHEGRVALSTPWAYKVEGGEIVGRYDRLALKGDVFEWLNRVDTVGATSQWIGARKLPEIVIQN